MPSYKSVKLQRKYFYISVQLELSQHFYWFMGPELKDKPEELTPEACSYVFKEWGWERRMRPISMETLPRLWSWTSLVAHSSDIHYFPTAKNPSSFPSWIRVHRGVRCLPVSRRGGGWADSCPLLYHPPDSYFLDFSPTV